MKLFICCGLLLLIGLAGAYFALSNDCIPFFENSVHCKVADSGFIEERNYYVNAGQPKPEFCEATCTAQPNGTSCKIDGGDGFSLSSCSLYHLPDNWSCCYCVEVQGHERVYYGLKAHNQSCSQAIVVKSANQFPDELELKAALKAFRRRR